MRFGYDYNQTRIGPLYSGQKAICPLCGGTIIGKCGEIYVWHWQHNYDRECDPWKEHETDWHRNWKAEFPEDWQEVIIEREGEKHFADVKTSNGLVIEFQHSSISSSTIRIREDFYGDMIWVIDAKSFKDNFKLQSVVKTKLRDIEKNALHEIEFYETLYNDDLKNIQNDIDKNLKNFSEKSYCINAKKQSLEKLKKVINSFDEYAENVIAKWANGEVYWDYDTSEITNSIETKEKDNLKELASSIHNLQREIESMKQQLLYIQQIKNFQIEDKQYKIIRYELINTNNFHKVRVIDKSTNKTFFPEIRTINSDLELISYHHKKEQYIFVIDPTDAISALTNKIEEDKKSIINFENSLLTIKQETKEKLFQECKNKIQVAETEIVQSQEELDELIIKINHYSERKQKISEIKELRLSQLKSQIEKKKRDQRFKVMKEQKGIYTFEWKHERKSWQAAYSSIYFDIGENYLFEMLLGGVFKKTMINEFLDLHLKLKG